MTAYPEPLVARVTGIGRPRLKKARLANLTKGPDWWLAESTVTYGTDGLKKLLLALGLNAADLAWPEPPTPPDVPPEPDRPASAALDPTAESAEADSATVAVAEVVVEKIVAEAAPALRELVVRKIAWNPSIVMAWDAATEREVRVRVRSNVNFRPGMVLRARAPEQADGLWFMEGNCPRWPGRY